MLVSSEKYHSPRCIFERLQAVLILGVTSQKPHNPEFVIFFFHRHSFCLEQKRQKSIGACFFSSKINSSQIINCNPKICGSFVADPREKNQPGVDYLAGQGSMPNSFAAMESYHTTSKTCRNTARLVKEAQTSTGLTYPTQRIHVWYIHLHLP